MKAADIQVGKIYHDGKQGLREVIAMGNAPVTVRYRLLAAKVEREFDFKGNETSLIGKESEVTLQAFMTWAKVAYTAEQKDEICTQLAAAKLKLSPGEVAVLQSLLDEISGDDAKAGLLFTFESGEGRAVNGLEKKGLLKRADKEQAEVLPLGAARLKAMAAA